jgi:hypothetical protein
MIFEKNRLAIESFNENFPCRDICSGFTIQSNLVKGVGNIKCLVDLQCFSSLCSRLGVPLKPEKTILPTTTIVIYGIEFDSNKLECRLPVVKIVLKVSMKIFHAEISALASLFNLIL